MLLEWGVNMELCYENDYVAKLLCGENISFVLGDNSYFQPMEYRVLQNQKDSCFVKCMKMLYNGKIQFFYLTQSYKSVKSELAKWGEKDFFVAIANMISSFITVKQFGFLSCGNINLSLEHIYVDTETFGIKFIYFPIKSSFVIDQNRAEQEFRKKLLEMCDVKVQFASAEMNNLKQKLMDSSLLLEKICIDLGGEQVRKSAAPEKKEQLTLRITAVNAPSSTMFEVNKPEYILGKDPSSVDGVIDYNRAVSRVHCKLVAYGDRYKIVDLQSKNGTYVNGMRVKPEQDCLLNNNDTIRLADSDFKITYE